MKQFLSFARKEFYHAFRDRKTLLVLFGLPIAQILLFGFALTNEIKNAKIAICDYAKDDASRRIIGKFAASNSFAIHKTLADHSAIGEAFKEGKIKMAVVFPANFNRDLLHQNAAQVQLIADASDPNTASTLRDYATSIIMDDQNSLSEASGRITTEMRMVYNPELKSAVNLWRWSCCSSAC